MPTISDLGRYLGAPFVHNRITKSTYDNVAEKIKSELLSWKINCLSLVGRVVLIQSASSTIPNYTMQTVKLSSTIIKEIDPLNKKISLIEPS